MHQSIIDNELLEKVYEMFLKYHDGGLIKSDYNDPKDILNDTIPRFGFNSIIPKINRLKATLINPGWIYLIKRMTIIIYTLANDYCLTTSLFFRNIFW